MAGPQDFDEDHPAPYPAGEAPWSVRITRQEVEAAKAKGRLLGTLHQTDILVTPEVKGMIEKAIGRKY